MYAVGASNTLRGTGVWSFVKADRAPKPKGGSEGTKRPAQKKPGSTQRFPGGKK